MAGNDSFISRKIRAKDVFEAYILEHHKDDLVAIFEAEDDEQHYSVFINFLTLFEAHLEVAESLLSRPVRLLPVLDKGLVCAARKLLNSFGEEAPGRTLKLNLHARIIGVPNCPELHRAAVPRTSDVGRLLCVFGTVVRTTPVKMLEYRKDFMCSKCKHVFTVEADYDQYYQLPRPTHCHRPDYCPSTNITPLTTSRPIHTKDYQEIKIQEQVQKLVVGTIPRSLWVTLEDDLVDTCQPGDDVLLCGSVHRRWRGTVRDVRPDIDLVLKANNVTVRNKQRSGTIVTDEMREEFTSFWQEYQYDPLTARNIILASLCPQVYGLYVVKLAVAMVVAGGVQRLTNTSTSLRGESHLLLVGDPGTGKSQFLKYISELEPRCVLTTGVGTTNAGLTVAAVREEGEWALEAGALVLADGGICCIDEFSSVREADRAAIHEAMEQQTISVAKAGLVCKLNSRCSVIAATNPKGEYDPDESITINTALASPLLSRFDVILVLLDMKNAEWDKVVSDYILQGRDPLKGDGGGKDDWSLEKLQAYFCHIRSLQPTMTPHANVILSRYYQLQRKIDQNNKSRTTIRLLESLVRLSQGHARLMMHTEVCVMDAVVAVQLMEASMSGAAVISGINPLHTSFPISPALEYKNHVNLIMQKLCLFDILTNEMNRLNEQEKLQVSHPTSVNFRENTKIMNTGNDTVQAFQQRNDFRPLVREDTAVSIEELEEVDSARIATQKTLCDMYKKKNRINDSQKPSTSKQNTKQNTKSKVRKGSKRKGKSSEDNSVKNSHMKKLKANTTKVRELDDCIESCSDNSQELVDKAGDELLEEFDDFESTSRPTGTLFCQKRKGSFLSGNMFKKKGTNKELGHNDKMVENKVSKYIYRKKNKSEHDKNEDDNESESEIPVLCKSADNGSGKNINGNKSCQKNLENDKSVDSESLSKTAKLNPRKDINKNKNRNHKIYNIEDDDDDDEIDDSSSPIMISKSKKSMKKNSSKMESRTKNQSLIVSSPDESGKDLDWLQKFSYIKPLSKLSHKESEENNENKVDEAVNLDGENVNSDDNDEERERIKNNCISDRDMKRKNEKEVNKNKCTDNEFESNNETKEKEMNKNEYTSKKINDKKRNHSISPNGLNNSGESTSYIDDSKDDGGIDRHRKQSALPKGLNNSFAAKLKQFARTSNDGENPMHNSQTPDTNTTVFNAAKKSSNSGNNTQACSDVNETVCVNDLVNNTKIKDTTEYNNSTKLDDDNDDDFFDIVDNVESLDYTSILQGVAIDKTPPCSSVTSHLSSIPITRPHNSKCALDNNIENSYDNLKSHKANQIVKETNLPISIKESDVNINCSFKKQKRSCFSLSAASDSYDVLTNTNINKTVEEADFLNTGNEGTERECHIYTTINEKEIRESEKDKYSQDSSKVHSGEFSKKININENVKLNRGKLTQSQGKKENSENKKGLLGNLILPFKKPTFYTSPLLTKSKPFTITKSQNNLNSDLVDDLNDIDFDL